MNPGPAETAEHGWGEVLRKALVALQGRAVGVWEADQRGRLRAVAASGEHQLPERAAGELEAALRDWQVDRPAGRRWVASRLESGRWCIAPVRYEPAGPPPLGVERRGRERMTLELAALGIGLIERPAPLAPRAANAILRESQARLSLLIENVPAVLWTTDRELRVTSRSGGLRSLDVLPERIPGASLLEQLRLETVTSESIAAHRRALDGESVSYTICRDERFYDARVEPLRSEVGAVVGVVGIAVDVSDRERALEEARRSQRELEDFFENASVAMHWAGRDGTILRANQAELELLGHTSEEYVGRNVTEFHADPSIAEDMRRRLSLGETLRNVEARLLHKDGSIRHVLISSNALFEGGRFVHTRCVTRDITERRRAEQQLLHGALHDPLTDLPNRVFFAERVGQALDRERREPGYRFAVVFLDLDEFKLVNDSLGHAAGDRLLADVAGRLRTCVRPGDVVARLGGDEFTLLLEFVATPADAEHATLRIQRSFAPPFEIDGREVFVTASIGVALSSEGYGRAEDLLRDADIAMYRAKARGRATFQVFDITMRDRQARRLGLETDLRNALERGEFRVVFQPIVELASGRVHGFEALLRWQHPQRGVIQPLEFIPLAEQTGLILPIGAWILHEACWYARRWQRAHHGSAPIRISVNLSAKQLSHPRLLEDVRGSLREAGLDPHHLGLEITESVLMENLESATAMLEELRRLDVELQIDDFGTGYSSLSYLPHFPLQAIKIDGSFVRRMGSRRTNLEVVRSIVELARNLGMGVIAEGVETADQRERLLAFGCELGQGFHFAAPMDPVSAGALLEEAAKKEPT